MSHHPCRSRQRGGIPSTIKAGIGTHRRPIRRPVFQRYSRLHLPSASRRTAWRPLRVEKALEAIDAELVIAQTNKDTALKMGFIALNNLNYAMIRVKAAEMLSEMR